MMTARSALGKMRQIILLCLLVLIVRTEAQIPGPCITSITNRPPENSDIFVTCGSNHIDLDIYICPMYQALYNESLMALNGQFGIPECYGIPDWSVDPPVLKFSLPLNTSSVSACGIMKTITDEVGTGQFSDISIVQFANFTGSVNSNDPAAGKVTFRPQILYKFSCFYPMQYLLNNTQLAVSGVNIAIKDSNGNFNGLVNLYLYADEARKILLLVPQKGLNLKTKIYVAVTATNLTSSFNVLLDRCFATTEPYPNTNSSYDLFVGCNMAPRIVMGANGISQTATFTFETFRFTEHSNLSVSTFYVHCVTRLCDVSTCANFLQNCNQQGKRRKREASDEPDSTTITSPAIRVGRNTNGEPQTFSAPYGASPESSYSSPVVALIVCLVILSICFFAMSAYFMYYIRRGKPIMQ